jgi:hypothetical protein
MRGASIGRLMRVAGLAAPVDADTGPPSAGVAGNERLTSSTAAVLFVLLAIEGVTVLSLDSLLTPHIFVGVVLIPPVLLKVATTGYRFVRYYRGSAPYVRKGPPPVLLRALGPLIVLSTGALLATGVALLVIGPGDGMMRGLHQVSFIVFLAVMSLHVLAHARKVPAQTAADWKPATRLPGSAGRRLVVVASLIAGIALGAVAIAYDGAWVHRSDRGETAAGAP